MESQDDRLSYTSLIRRVDKLSNSEAVKHHSNELKASISQKFQHYFHNLQECRQQLISMVIDALNSDRSTSPPKREPKMQSTSKTKGKVRREKLSGLEVKLNETESFLSSLIRKVEAVDSLSSWFKERPLERLMSINKNGDFAIRNLHKLGVFHSYLKYLEIEWDKADQSNKVTVDENDPRILIVDSKSCYNWFRTNLWLEDEDFIIEFETNITHQNQYWYIGLQNESIIYSSNCMCCNVKNAFYLRCDGNVHIDSVKTHIPSLDYRFETQMSTVVMRVQLSEKKIWFSVNNGKEQGPFEITGSKFKVIAGSCNNCTGKVTISNCYFA